MNRRLVDLVSGQLCCPTETSLNNPRAARF
jgi:hypothetical protein